MTKSARGLCVVAVLLLTACGATIQSWNHLNVDQGDWRGFRQAHMPSGWQVMGGALTRVGPGGDIITKEQYESFELTLDWKISPGGNSGVFFHVVEDSARKYVWETGPEMQILDNAGHADGKIPNTSAASNFAMHAPSRDVTKPVGEWNQARLLVDGPHVEHWLNGVKVLEYELWSDDWAQRVQASKFKSMPLYGKSRSGHIALQDHGDWVAFRNIKIRRIK
jgi:hypothetical protein